MAQAETSEKILFVWAAGNAHGDPCDPSTTDHCEDGAINGVSVEVLPGLAARIEELRGHTIAVVALSPDEGLIADFSNRCGIAADFCIAAPGRKGPGCLFRTPFGSQPLSRWFGPMPTSAGHPLPHPWWRAGWR